VHSPPQLSAKYSSDGKYDGTSVPLPSIPERFHDVSIRRRQTDNLLAAFHTSLGMFSLCQLGTPLCWTFQG
jgi:hypothetical protein